MKNNFRLAVGLEEGVHYSVVKDGHDFEYPVAIASHEKFMPRKSGIIQIESFRIAANEAWTREEGRADIETRSIFRCVKDKDTGLWFGVPMGVDPIDKTIKWQPISLRMRQPFDLSNPRDRGEWSMISRMSSLEGSPNQLGKPLFKVVDKDQKSLNYLKIYEKRKDALEIVESLDEIQRRDTAFDCGINADAFSHVMLKAELFQFADKNAEKFLTIWNNPNRPVVSVYNKAIRFGVITFDSNGNGKGMDVGYYYRGLFLGDVEATVIASLSAPEHASRFASIAVQVKDKEEMINKQRNAKPDEHSQSNVTAQQQTPHNKLSSVEDNNDELTKAKAEIEALKKELLDKDTKKVPEQGGEPQKKEKAPISPELEKLRLEGKELKIQGAHMMGEDKLKDAIRKKKLATMGS